MRRISMSDSFSTLDNIFVAATPTYGYQAFLLQLADDGDELLLGGLHIADADRPQSLHVFLQHFRGALRHAFFEMIADLTVSPLQRGSEDLAVGLGDQLGHAVAIDVEDVFEYEHHVAYGGADGLVLLVDFGEDGLGH